MATLLGDNPVLISPTDITIGELLGRGGYGDVSLATRKNWGDVVVKKFNKISLKEEILEESEKIWRVISFPYLVNILGIIDEPGKPFSVVMEYLEFGNLKNFNRKYMMRCNCWARKIKMIQEISLGMSYLHIQGLPVTHRSLKLDDVLVGLGFIVKIGDHGLIFDTKTILDVYDVSILRSYSHMPSEAWTDTAREPDEFWNVYAFAVTLYELLTGKDPWPEHVDPTQISVSVRDGKRPDMNEIPAKTPTEIISLMQKCWDKTPSKRPPFQGCQPLTRCTGISNGSQINVAEIQKTVSGVFLGKFKESIRRADKAIMDMISDDESKRQTTPSVTENNVENSKSKQRQPNVRDTSKASQLTSENTTTDTSTDSHLKVSDAHNMKGWHLVKRFGREGDADGDFRLAESIAVSQQGDIAVVDTRTSAGGKRVYLFDKDGIYKFTLKSRTTDSTGKLLLPEDVAVTSQGHLVVADQSKYVKMFHVDGSFIDSFCTLAPDDDPHAKVNTTRVAVTPQNDILVGDVHRRLVTIHAQTDDWAPRKVVVPIRPWYLATNIQRHILVSDDWERTVIALSFEGEVVFTIEDFKADGHSAEPYGMVCDNNDIYIAVMKVSKNNLARQGTGHIHQYDNSGKFLRCIAKGLRHPYGIAMSNGSLYVANKKSVLIYSTEDKSK